jgi:predicted small lipoprotein YifL
MKKSFLTLAAIALVFSFTSCKETTVEKTEDTEVNLMETETESPVEVIEEAPIEEVDVDSTSTEEAQVQ